MWFEPAPGNKLHAERVSLGGERFDSKREARRWQELLWMQKAGEISDLRRQVKYVLIPTQREPGTVGKRGAVKPGRIIEREVAYYADFVYMDRNGETVVEDAKGFRDPSSATYAKYVLKRKMMLFFHGIRVREV